MKKAFSFLLFVICLNNLFAFQDSDEKNSLKGLYLSASFGVINYDYSENLLIGNYETTGITGRNAFAGRFSVGYHLTEKWDIEFSVMRPGAWVQYNFDEPRKFDKSVWTNIWALSGRRNFRFFSNTRLYLEAGISNVSRTGFDINKEVVIPSVRYIYPITSAGLLYPISSKIDAAINFTYSPQSNKYNQPATSFIAGGIVYHVREQSDEVKNKYLNTEYKFPDHLFHIGYASDAAGFNINRQFSSGLDTSIPMFWLGDVFVENGITASYQKNIFHTEKNFSFSAGASLSYLNTQKDESFYTISVFPVIKWWFLRTKPVDLYFNYSLIGPAYISSSVLDGLDTGEEFTFQDFMGIGFLFGKGRNYNLDLKIAHYSNGNIFTDNPGVAVPLMLSFGYALY
ncbi:acyloxyacyl hydrolase [Christiangramia sp. SM2212]|uniref:Acyloxyacyl hydrolase n=1 Tax=Christiangramia sediminicola TaxID=3073267 RepID=A0ABU1EM06_9FLAO|nr:acyloxyacyl hydrolase [Christiangramia sp. SM2212]MDR5589392.1 acyloxyacyl hydrolase [Christiangramia sp. SM2212]